MRGLFAVMVLGLAVAFLNAAQGTGAKVEVKGPHICCKQCIKVVATILGKVDGVSDVKSDIKTKIVAFTAKDDTAAKAGVKALVDGGFFGEASADGKELRIDVPAGKKGKVDVVTVKDVHVCCGQCVSAVNSVFKKMEAKVSYAAGTGPQKTISVERTASLEPAAVLEALRKAGFNGTVVEK